jgi:hypothetical protein
LGRVRHKKRSTFTGKRFLHPTNTEKDSLSSLDPSYPAWRGPATAQTNNPRVRFSPGTVR